MNRSQVRIGSVWKSLVNAKWMLRLLVTGLAVLGSLSQTHAALLTVRPIPLVSGPDYSITATGTLTTIGNTSTISDWNLTVTTAERAAHYSRANTANLSFDVSSDGQRITVPTSPDGVLDGGSLFFRSLNPFRDFGVAVANFTSAFSAGGEAFYLAGGGFDFLQLNQPDGVDYVAAHASPLGGNLFDLVPLSFSGGVTVSGTLRTNGTTGLLDTQDIVAWDIFVDVLTQDVFNPTNSTLLASDVALSSTGLDLTVNNPDGFLTFSKGFLGGRRYALQLADFSGQSPAGGQAGYFRGRFAANTLDLHAGRGPWRVTGTDPVIQPVPEPASGLLFSMVMTSVVVGGLKRRGRQPVHGRTA